MSFAAPWWLVGLVGWLAVTLWVLRRRREKLVPFLSLWQREPVAHRRPPRQVRTPPLPILAILLAILLAVVSAAMPFLGNRYDATKLTIVVDRGLTMSAPSPSGAPRFVQAAQLARSALPAALPRSSVDLTVVPPTNQNAPTDFLQAIQNLGPTALLDPTTLAQTARQALDAGNTVVVLSDQPLGVANPRLIQISGQSAPNIGIDSLSVRADPRPQAMVGIINNSTAPTATLTLHIDNQSLTRTIDLPPTGQRRNYFLDLPSPGSVIEAEIQTADPAALNHNAWAIRTSTWPNITRSKSLPEDLDRMIDVYARHRPPMKDSRRVAVITASDPIPAAVPVAILDNDPNDAQPLSSVDPLIVNTAPLDLSHLAWPTILPQSSIHPAPPGDWTPLVIAAGKTIVAARQQPARQIWIGFNSERFSHQIDYVLFWSKIFDWLGGGSRAYNSNLAARLSSSWQLQTPPGTSLSASDIGLVPGLYRRSDGALSAVNAPPTPPIASSILPTDWRDQLSRAAASSAAAKPLGPPLLLAADALCLAAAAAVSLSSSRRVF
jgi:hypothetical protein